MAMLPKSVRKLLVHHEVQMAFTLVWVWGPVILTLAGFYLGTWIFSQHVKDLQGADIDKGVIGAVIGLVISIIVATCVSLVYPKKIAAEYQVREAELSGEGHHHHHH